jgi:acyl carrier protein
MTSDRVREAGRGPSPPILDGVRSVLRTHLAIVQPVDPDTDLTEELQLDSLAQLTLIVELENHFRICFEPDDEQGIQTVGDLVAVIARLLLEERPACAS